MTTHASHPPTPGTTPTEQPRDPVCGMFVAGPLFVLHGDTRYHFCSERCRQKFLADPARYLDADALIEGMTPTPVPPVAAVPGTRYTCPMHPEIVQDGPGTCPKCGMAL